MIIISIALKLYLYGVALWPDLANKLFETVQLLPHLLKGLNLYAYADVSLALPLSGLFEAFNPSVGSLIEWPGQTKYYVLEATNANNNGLGNLNNGATGSNTGPAASNTFNGFYTTTTSPDGQPTLEEERENARVLERVQEYLADFFKDSPTPRYPKIK